MFLLLLLFVCQYFTVVTITLSQSKYKPHCFVVLCVVITRRVVQQFFFPFLKIRFFLSLGQFENFKVYKDLYGKPITMTVC